jgi:transposase
MSKLPISEQKRIERVSALKNHIIVGIDPASKNHTAVVYAPNRLPYGRILSIKNRRHGFEFFEKHLTTVKEKYPNAPVTFVIEASGEYWKPFQHYFEMRGVETVFMPPLYVKRTRDLDDNTPRSNDPKDAVRIANLALEGRYFQSKTPPEVFENLKQLVRSWDTISGHLIQCRHRIRSHLDTYFPEFSTLFCDILGVTPLVILKHWPFPHELRQVSLEQLCSVIRQNVGNGRVDAEKMEKLLALADESIGIVHGIDGARMRLKNLLEHVELYKKQLSELRRPIRQSLRQIDYAEKITSIHGIGIISTAQFLGYLGNVHDFDKVNQVMDVAGLTLTATESGGYKSRRQISHRGRSALRRVLYEMAMHYLRAPNTARRKYFKLRLNGKSHRQAVIAVIPHLIKTIFAVVKQDRIYTPLPADDPVTQEIRAYEALLKKAS